MADRIVGVADLITTPSCGDVNNHTYLDDDIWFWCRAHREAEHYGREVRSWSEPQDDGTAVTLRCTRIGPFMSKYEADRCGEMAISVHGERPILIRTHLGMEIEDENMMGHYA